MVSDQKLFEELKTFQEGLKKAYRNCQFPLNEEITEDAEWEEIKPKQLPPNQTAK